MLAKAKFIIFGIAAFFSILSCNDSPSWDGTWHFSECWKALGGNGDCVEYALKINNYGKECSFLENGHLAYIDATCRIQNQNNEVYVIIKSLKSESDLLKPNDTLFSLVRREGKIFTHWIALPPTFDENQKDGIYFQSAE